MSERMQAFVAGYRDLITRFGFTVESATLTAQLIESDYSDMRDECYEWLLENMPEADQIV